MNAIYYGRELYGGNELSHSGTKGMKWGYADGQRVAGKRTAEEEIADAVKSKNYAALQNQVNALAKAGKKPEEIQKMLNDNIAQNSINESYQKKDYAAIQAQVDKMVKEGRKPEEIEAMLWKAQGLDYSKKGTKDDPRKNMKSTGSSTKSSDSKTKRSEYTKGDSDFDEKNFSDSNLIKGTDLYKIKSKSGNDAVLFEDTKFELPKGKKLTPDIEKQLGDYFAELHTKAGKSGTAPADYDKIQKIIDSGTKSSNGDFKGSAKRRGT